MSWFIVKWNSRLPSLAGNKWFLSVQTPASCGAAVAAGELFAFTQTKGLIAAPSPPLAILCVPVSHAAGGAASRRRAARRSRASASFRSRSAKIAPVPSPRRRASVLSRHARPLSSRRIAGPSLSESGGSSADQVLHAIINEIPCPITDAPPSAIHIQA